jgi:hypothetical protein
MRYLLILATFLLLAACENEDSSKDTSGTAMSNAISDAMDQTKPEEVAETVDANMADMAEAMGSTIDDAKSAVAELEEAAKELEAESEMEQAKKLIGE